MTILLDTTLLRPLLQSIGFLQHQLSSAEGRDSARTEIFVLSQVIMGKRRPPVTEKHSIWNPNTYSFNVSP